VVLEIRRILCPIDFSDTSRHALDHSIAMAKWFGAELTGLHVRTPEPLPQPPILLADGSRSLTDREADRQQSEERLREWLSMAAREGIRVACVVEEAGNPTRRILDRANAWPADLIVMGTHGRGGFERFVLGSVTEKVLRKAPCPVLTVPPRSASSRLPFKQVLCPVDFSDSSITASRLALILAEESDASLTLLHIFEWPSDEAAAKRLLETSEFHRQWELDTRQKLEDLIPAEALDWCKPSAKLAFGKPYQQILAVAAAEEADIIVMGVHGRNPLDLILFGSTTNQVVRQATCPVLTLKR
jgi:nucleotide-binding universal stress UspA family protein